MSQHVLGCFYGDSERFGQLVRRAYLLGVKYNPQARFLMVRRGTGRGGVWRKSRKLAQGTPLGRLMGRPVASRRTRCGESEIPAGSTSSPFPKISGILLLSLLQLDDLTRSPRGERGGSERAGGLTVATLSSETRPGRMRRTGGHMKCPGSRGDTYSIVLKHRAVFSGHRKCYEW